MVVLVTGGGGFLGSAIVRRLLEQGYAVRSFARSAQAMLAQAGAEVVRGDLANAAAVDHAVAGCEAVFHVGAKAGVWGPANEYESTNVAGTGHVLAACQRLGVRELIYTSTPSVVSDGSPLQGVDESAPYAERYLTDYPRTKARAEQLVLAANTRELATIAIRPPLIWGPGDRHLIPRILERARRRRLRRVGRHDPTVDTIYIDNAVDAHLAAWTQLREGRPVGGRAYFVSNGQPIGLWRLIDRILDAAGLPPVDRSISPRAAYAAGAVLECLWATLRLRGEPPMTRFVARQLCTERWFNIEAARRDLGYEPRVTLEEGLRRLRVWLQVEAKLAPSG